MAGQVDEAEFTPGRGEAAAVPVIPVAVNQAAAGFQHIADRHFAACKVLGHVSTFTGQQAPTTGIIPEIGKPTKG